MISKVGAISKTAAVPVAPALASLLTEKEVAGVTSAVSIAAMLAMFRVAAVVERQKAEAEVERVRASHLAKIQDDAARLRQLQRARQLTEDQMRVSLMNKGVYPGADPFSAPYVAEAARRNAAMGA